MNDIVGICSKCSLVQKINRCPSELSAKLVIDDPENELHTFTAFQNMIRKITEDDTIDETTTTERITITLMHAVETLHLLNTTYVRCVITGVHHGGMMVIIANSSHSYIMFMWKGRKCKLNWMSTWIIFYWEVQHYYPSTQYNRQSNRIVSSITAAIFTFLFTVKQSLILRTGSCSSSSFQIKTLAKVSHYMALGTWSLF